MRLTPQQVCRFNDIVDGLAAFSVAMLRFVMLGEEQNDHTTESVISILDSRQVTEDEIVSATELLWSSPWIIELFAKLNPFSLDKSDIEQVKLWTDALFGPFVLVGYDDRERALLLTDEDVIAMCGVLRDPRWSFPCEPLVVQTVLVPFDGIVTHVGAFSIAPVDLLSTQGISDGAEDTLDQMLARANEKGVVSTAQEFVRRSREVRERKEQAQLQRMAADVDRKARMSGDVQPKGFRRSVFAGVSKENRAFVSKRHLRRFEHMTVATIDRPVVMTGDTDAVVNNDCVLDACHCAFVMADLFGIVPVRDVFEQFGRWFDHDIGLDEFVSILEKNVDACVRSFAIWRDGSTDADCFVICAPLGALRRQERMDEYEDPVCRHFEPNATGSATFALTDGDEDGARKDGNSDERLTFDTFLRSIIRGHETFPAREIPDELAHKSLMEWMLEMPTAVQLRSYLDLHTPDGVDGRTFADDVTLSAVACAVAFPPAPFEDFVEYIGETPVSTDEGVHDDVILLARDIWNTMPRIENNGLSRLEATAYAMGFPVEFEALWNARVTSSPARPAKKTPRKRRV